MIHMIRHSINCNLGVPTIIFFQKDIKNAFIEIFLEIFLDEYRRYASSSTRFAE